MLSLAQNGPRSVRAYRVDLKIELKTDSILTFRRITTF